MLEENPDGLQVPAIPEYQDRWNDKFQEHQHNNPTELRLCGGVVALFMDAAFASDMLSSESERHIFGPGWVFFSYVGQLVGSLASFVTLILVTTNSSRRSGTCACFAVWTSAGFWEFTATMPLSAPLTRATQTSPSADWTTLPLFRRARALTATPECTSRLGGISLSPVV